MSRCRSRQIASGERYVGQGHEHIASQYDLRFLGAWRDRFSLLTSVRNSGFFRQYSRVKRTSFWERCRGLKMFQMQFLDALSTIRRACCHGPVATSERLFDETPRQIGERNTRRHDHAA